MKYMTESWSGLYLKTDRDRASDVTVRLAQTRGYEIDSHTQCIDISTLREIFSAGLPGLGVTCDVLYLATADNDWTQVIGLGNTCYPRLFFSSEIVMILGCDAFECGFLDTVSWWYSYYEKGLLVDRFDSNAKRTFLDSRDDLFGPDDPRAIYLRCSGLKNRHAMPFPQRLASFFQGHPERLVPILKEASVDAVQDILSERWPEVAIRRFSQFSTLPHIGELSTSDIFDGVVNTRIRSEPIPASILEIIRRGLTMIVMQHPKLALH